MKYGFLIVCSMLLFCVGLSAQDDQKWDRFPTRGLEAQKLRATEMGVVTVTNDTLVTTLADGELVKIAITDLGLAGGGPVGFSDLTGDITDNTSAARALGLKANDADVIKRGVNNLTNPLVLQGTNGKIFVSDGQIGIESDSSLGFSIYPGSNQAAIVSEDGGSFSTLTLFPYGIRRSLSAGSNIITEFQSGDGNSIAKVFVMDSLYNNDNDIGNRLDIQNQIDTSIAGISGGSGTDNSLSEADQVIPVSRIIALSNTDTSLRVNDQFGGRLLELGNSVSGEAYGTMGAFTFGQGGSGFTQPVQLFNTAGDPGFGFEGALIYDTLTSTVKVKVGENYEEIGGTGSGSLSASDQLKLDNTGLPLFKNITTTDTLTVENFQPLGADKWKTVYNRTQVNDTVVLPKLETEGRTAVFYPDLGDISHIVATDSTYFKVTGLDAYHRGFTLYDSYSVSILKLSDTLNIDGKTNQTEYFVQGGALAFTYDPTPTSTAASSPSEDNTNPELITGSAMAYDNETNQLPLFTIEDGVTPSVIVSDDTEFIAQYAVRLTGTAGSSKNVRFNISGLTSNVDYEVVVRYNNTNANGRVLTNGGSSNVNLSNLDSGGVWSTASGIFQTAGNSINVDVFTASLGGQDGDLFDFKISVKLFQN